MPEAARAPRDDAREALAAQPSLARRLAGQRIAVVGGTGFVGAWLAEAVAALNDDSGARLRIDLLGRSAAARLAACPQFARDDIAFRTIDVRSPFELAGDTTHVVHAAGLNHPATQASEPYRVFQTTLYGIDHALAAAGRLERLERFLNISSGLVLGHDLPDGPLAEAEVGRLDFARPHNAYAEWRRSAEALVTGYASQFRLPVCTLRAFTFLGPYQAFDAPWALNSFIRDALTGGDIRIHGDGATRRAYLYGADVAVWVLKALADAKDGAVLNLGGAEPIRHLDAARRIAERVTPTPEVVLRSAPRAGGRVHDFLPDLREPARALGLAPTVGVEAAIDRTLAWHAGRVHGPRRLR